MSSVLRSIIELSFALKHRRITRLEWRLRVGAIIAEMQDENEIDELALIVIAGSAEEEGEG